MFLIEDTQRTHIMEVGKPLKESCAGMSLHVLRADRKGARGDDPVEMQRFALLSRRFLSKLNRAHPELVGRPYKVRRRGKSAVLELIAAGSTTALVGSSGSGKRCGLHSRFPGQDLRSCTERRTIAS